MMNLRRKRRRGTAAIELAFVAPALILFIFGLFEFTRMVMLQQALTNAAREGCRFAALANTVSKDDVDDEVRDYLNGVVANVSDTGKVRVVVDPTTLSGIESETVITVTVDVDYEDAALFSPWFLDDITVHGEARMKRE